eukprot:1158167-Pelagomonas_calceolata.AAC.1
MTSWSTCTGGSRIQDLGQGASGGAGGGGEVGVQQGRASLVSRSTFACVFILVGLALFTTFKHGLQHKYAYS